MSWHKTHRTTLVYQAILACLLGTTSLAHAINLGQANIQSAQHEPLSATIEVSDIDAKNFNVSIATADIYQQLGLDANAKISAKFTATSESSGRITLTSSAPISAPFTDIVLNLNDNGKQVIEPQTLLMPLPKSGTFKLPEKHTEVITADVNQNLPVVTPEKSTNTTQTDIIAQDETNTNAKETLPAKSAVQTSVTNKTAVNKQADILTEQVTRTIYPAGQAPKEPIPTENKDTNKPELAADTTNTDNDKDDSVNNTMSDKAYVVQSGDSLWSIANQIAKANNMTVNEVMKAIHAANPDAFNHGKMNQLKANVSLQLPDYEVIPSQKAIQEAISAKQQHKQQATKKAASHKKTSDHQIAKSVSKPHNTQTTKKPAKQALPKAQVTLVTPTQQGKATGTNNKPAKNATTGGDSNLVGTLKNTRQQTATNAKQVNSLNKELSSATHKLQLQNQKLAELEARLKALKEKK